MTVAADGLQKGVVYKLRYLAVNVYGSSDLSEKVNAGVSSFPIKPNSVTKVEFESSQTAITLAW